jgi:hypothetical protein
MRELVGSRNIVTLPRHEVVFASIPGRIGQRMLQGEAFLPAKQKRAAAAAPSPTSNMR